MTNELKDVNAPNVVAEKKPRPKRTKPANKKSVFDTIAIVYWDDACSHDEWTDTETHLRGATGLVAMVSIGFVLKETEKEIQIVRTADEDEQANEGMFAIPKGMIKRIDYKKYKRITE